MCTLAVSQLQKTNLHFLKSGTDRGADGCRLHAWITWVHFVYNESVAQVTLELYVVCIALTQGY